MVTPVTSSELKEEMDAWQMVLKSMIQEISNLEIDAISQEGEEKQASINALTPLNEEKSRIVERLKVVMTEFQLKGGDIESTKKYVDSVSGLSVDVDDAGKTLTVLKNWLMSPEGGIKWGRNIILFIVPLFVGRIISSAIGKVAKAALEKTNQGTSALLKDFLVNIIRKIIFFISLGIALNFLGVQTAPFLATIVAVGFIVGFALQWTLNNLASGIMILLHRPFDIGNFVEAGGVSGTVESLNLASTTFKTPDNQSVIVPNGNIWGGVIRNITGNPTRRVDMTFGIGYDDDIEKAEKIILNILSKHPKILKDPSPTVKLHELADSSVNFVCRPWSKTSDYWDVYWDVTKSIKQRFDSEKISIPYPQQDVHVHNTQS